MTLRPITYSIFRLLLPALFLASLASAQSEPPITCSEPGTSAIPIRNEGKTEQVNDYFFTCINSGSGAQFSNMTVTATIPLTLTSRVLNSSSGITEATVVVTNGDSTVTTGQGTISGNTVTFALGSVSFPGSSSLTLDITNIRVDATGQSSGAAVSETVSVSGTNLTTASFGAMQVATVEAGINSSVTQANNFGAGNNVNAAAPAATIGFAEGAQSPTAFKIQGNSDFDSEVDEWLEFNTETGYYVTVNSTSNQASSATRIRVIFNHVPTGMNIYVPTQIFYNPDCDCDSGSAALTATESGAFSAILPASTQPTGYTGMDLAQLTVSSGSAEAVYEIQEDNDESIDTYSVPVYLTGTVPSSAPTMTAAVSFAPIAATSNVPDFTQLASSTTTLNASQFNIAVTTSSLGVGERTVPYSQTLHATGGTGPYTWSLSSGASQLSGLGLSLNGSTGVISGTPSSIGSATIVALATDSTGGTASSSSLTVSINQLISISTTSLPNGAVGESYSTTVAAVNGVGSYTWTTSGGSLPPGLNPINSSTGVISGTPTTTGSYGFTITVTDSVGGAASLVLNNVAAPKVTINPALAITTTNANIPVGVNGIAYVGANASSTGGVGAHSYSITSGLSALTTAGMTFDTAGHLGGTPNTTGTINFQITVTDAGGGSATTSTLTLTLNSPISFSTTSLPAGSLGVAYSQQLVVTGGSGQYTWSSTPFSGSFPAGSPAFSVSNSGLFTGTPNTAGTSPQFQIRVVDAVYTTSSATSGELTVQVNQPTTTSLVSSLTSPSTFGQALTLTATVTPSTTTGKVVFYDGVVPIGAGTISSGHATLTTSLLEDGSHSLKAYFPATGNNLTSTSSQITQVVTSQPQNGFQPGTVYALGSLSSVANTKAYATAVGDFNHDGKVDVAIADYNSGAVSIYLGNGDGTLGTPTSVAVGTTPTSIVVGDFNGDGNLDLAVTNRSSNTVSILLGSGAGGFAAHVDYGSSVLSGPSSVAIGDFNGDGFADLAIASTINNQVVVLLGNGDGTFSSSVTLSTGANTNPEAVIVGDFNNDGIADIVVANSGATTIDSFPGLSATSATFGGPVVFSTGAISAGAPSIAMGDFNGDGHPDLVVGNQTSNQVSIFLGTSIGSFGLQTPLISTSAPSFAAVGDFNGDGHLDFVVSNFGASSSAATVFIGNGAGGFSSGSTYSAGTGAAGNEGLAVADFNGDGVPDLSVASFDGLSNAGSTSIMLGQVQSLTLSCVAETAPVVNQSYAVGCTATGGIAPYTYSVTGLPSGLSPTQDGNTYFVQGTPTATGTFVVHVTDSETTTQSATSSITVSTLLTLVASPLPVATENVFYTENLVASGGVAPFTCTYGSLPAGLSMSGCVLSGTPTFGGNGTAVFTVNASDSSNAHQTASRQYSLTSETQSTAAPVISGVFGAGTIAVNGTTRLNFAITNPQADTQTLFGIGFTDSLPAGLTVASTPNLTGNCGGGTITAVANAASVSLTGASLAPGASCAFSVNVTGTAAGILNNSVTVASSNGGTGNTVEFTIVVGSGPISYVVVNEPDAGGLVRVAADGSSVTTIAAAAGGYDVAQDASGNFAVAAVGELLRVVPSGVVSTIATAGSGSQYIAVAVDPSGNFIVGDNETHQIWRISPDGVSTVAVATYPVSSANGDEDLKVAVDVHGNYIVAEDNSGAVHIFSITPSGAITPLTLTGSTLPTEVGGLTFDQNGNYMVLDANNDSLYRVTPQGAVTQFASGAGRLGLARNPVTNEYVGGTSGALEDVGPSGNSVTLLGGESSLLGEPESVIAVPGDFISNVDATGPLGYFRLQATSGTSEVNAYTYAQSSTGASISGSGAPIGASANSVLLDGSTGDVSTSLAGGINTAGTVMAWVNLSALPSTRSNFSYIAGESQVGNDFDLQFSTSNVLGFFTTNNGQFLGYTPNPNTLVNQWHMIVATFDATAGTRAIYWDGALVASDTVTSLTNKTTAFQIGSSPAFSGRNLAGKVEEAGVWNYALNAGQVYRLFESTAGLTASPSSVSLTPATTTAGTNASLTIAGQGFAAASTVWFTSSNGQKTSVTPTSVQPSQIVASIPSSIVPTAGIAEVAVANASGVPSNQLPLTLTAPTVVVTGPVVYPPLGISSSSLPPGQIGVPYGPVVLSATGGSGIYSWSASGLPTGLGISSNGIISGTPTSLSAGVTITVRDNTTSATASTTLSLVVTTVPLQISGPVSLGSVKVGGSVSGSFSAQGGLAPYTWSLLNPPPGLAVDASGHVSGTLSQSGTFGFAVQVEDSLLQTSSLTVSASAFGILTASLPAASTLAPYSATIATGGGTAPLSFTATGVPPGMTFAGGALGGQPLNPGSATIAVQVTDANGLTASASYSLTITGPGPLTIPESSLPGGAAGTAYSQTLTGSGGVPPYTWSITGGALPAGFSFSPSGVVAGLPSAPSFASFGVSAVDTNGAIALGTISLNIAPVPLTITSGTILPDAMALVDYPGQLLSATGGTPPYTFSVSGNLPDGLSLSNGQITGTPTTAGAYNFGLVVTDSAASPLKATQATQITVKPNSPDLVLSTGNVSFALTSGSSAVPSADLVDVHSSFVSDFLGFTATTSPAVPWLTVTPSGTTPATVSIGLSSAALALTSAGSPYITNVVVTCTSAACAGSSQTVAVTLTVTDLPAVLTTSPSLLSFTALTSNPQSSSSSIVIQNAGGGLLRVSSVTAADPWLSIGSAPASIPAGPGSPVTVTANPAGLAAGLYRSTINIATSAGNTAIPVAFLISGSANMTLGPAGTQFTMPQGGALGNPGGSFLVSVSTSANIGYHAAVLPGASWLVLGAANGNANATTPGNVTFSVDPTASVALPAGAYYGTIRVTASGILNAPQDFQVVLNITPATQSVTLDPEPGGLIFLASPTGGITNQTIQVFASSTTPLAWQATATVDSGSWLSISPSTGMASAGLPGQVAVSVSFTGLTPGVYRGQVTFASGGSAVRAVNVTLIVAGGNSTVSQSTSASGIRPDPNQATACAGAQLVPTQTGLVNSFSAPASWPTPISVTLLDTCANPIGTGQVVTTFSNGDPPLVLSPVNPAQGLYSATWTPRKSSSQVTIAARATASGFSPASVQIAGQVIPNAAPQLVPNATSDIFNPQVGAGLGPGNIVQIYGTNLANQPSSPTILPLPTTVTGTTVVIGGIQAPLYYVSPTQINAQIPFQLTPGNQYQVVVSANGALTSPQPIQLNAGTPAVLQFTSGQVIAEHPDGSLIGSSSPANPGEYVVIFLTGLGTTDQNVVSGAASPSNPLARVVNVPTLTLNGNQLPLLFAGLTPGLVGLYQINFQIPAGLATGIYQLQLNQSGTLSNTAYLPIQAPPPQ